jgi:hypothetical protein
VRRHEDGNSFSLTKDGSIPSSSTFDITASSVSCLRLSGYEKIDSSEHLSLSSVSFEIAERASLFSLLICNRGTITEYTTITSGVSFPSSIPGYRV